MSWLVTAKQYIPAVIGEEFGGGYFAGYISHTADGNPTHALIVAPRATGATGGGYTQTTNLAWATNTTTSGVNYSTTSIGANANKAFDGVSVMNQIVALGDIANFPAFEFCKNFNAGGYTDWYLPSRVENDIAYFNLKPNSSNNGTFFGANSYSVPIRLTNYTTSYPGQTFVSSFITGGSQAFVGDNHWSSTEESATNARRDYLINGPSDIGKTVGNRVRAFRRIAI